jgi:hypothetical protein
VSSNQLKNPKVRHRTPPPKVPVAGENENMAAKSEKMVFKDRNLLGQNGNK